MESLFQSYPSVGSDDRMRAVVIHHQLVIDIQHTAIVRRRTKSINPVFRHINQPREDISEMVFPFGICNGRLRHDSLFQQRRFFNILHRPVVPS